MLVYQRVYDVIWGFLTMGVPPRVGLFFSCKILLEWVIWGFWGNPHFRKPPHVILYIKFSVVLMPMDVYKHIYNYIHIYIWVFLHTWDPFRATNDLHTVHDSFERFGYTNWGNMPQSMCVYMGSRIDANCVLVSTYRIIIPFNPQWWCLKSKDRITPQGNFFQ